MKLSKHLEGNILIINLLEDLDISNSAEFSDEVTQDLSEKLKRIVIDFSRVGYVDSSGIGAIARVYRLIKEEKEVIVFSGCNENIRNIFTMVNFHRYFRMVETVEEACKDVK